MSKVKVEYTIELTDPIRDARGEETTTLTFRKARVGDLRVFDNTKGDADSMIRLVAALCNLPPSSVDAISLDDWPRVVEHVTGFLGSLAQVKPKATTS